MTVPTYFLSYSREDIEDIKTIAGILKIHGIETWQDTANLGAGISEERIRRAIREESDGLLFLATAQSVRSDFIRAVELPEAERKFKMTNFQIVPIFGLPIDAVTAELQDCLTVPISNFNGVQVTKCDATQDMVTVAERAAEIILEDISIEPRDPLDIGLSSKQNVSDNVALHLDFGSFFQGGLPPEESWSKQFRPALERVKNALVARNLLVLRLHGFAHLSLACLFGHVFRSTAGFKLEIRQITKNKTTIWATAATFGKSPLKTAELPGSIGSRNLCVKINLMSPDDSSVIRYRQEHGILYRTTLEFYPEEYPLLITEAEAVAIAADMVNKIKEMHARYDTNTVHLFAAIPIGLAVMIGHNLNACGTIQCHEFDNGRREYFASCTLR